MNRSAPAAPRPQPRPTAPTLTDDGLVGGRVTERDSNGRPTSLGRFRISQELGRGGMGVVLEAYDPALERRVAIKLLSAELDERRAARLMREARALGRLSHPNVVAVYEVGIVDGQGFIAMELVAGESLRQWHERPRPWSEVLEVYLQAGKGLAAAHAEGLVHRDFKPSNCLISPSGRVRVVDFGLAGDVAQLRGRESPSSGEPEPSGEPERNPERLTRPGAIMGTPAYMSPEQRLGEAQDPRSDQYSFCVSICEAIFGDAALPAGMSSEHPRVEELERAGPRIPRRLRRALERGLALDSEARWPSMDALLQELERCRRSRERRRWVVALVGTNLAVMGLFWGIGGGEPRCEEPRERLTGVWDAERALAVEAAIVGTGVPYGQNTAATVRARLNRYAETWARLGLEACEAAHVRGELSEAGLDLRTSCLDGRRQALAHAVEQLLEGDADVAEQAVRVVAGLPSLQRCADVQALQATPRPPDALAEDVATVREQLDRVRTRQRAGRYEVALAGVSEAITRAESLGHEPLVAETRLLRGSVYLSMGRYEDAASDLRRARAVALRHDHAEVAAEAAASLVFVVGVPMAQREGAELLGESALALAQRVDEGGPREVEALVGMAQVLAKHGDDAEAETRFSRALELLRAQPEADPLERVAALDGLRGVLRRQGRLGEAEQLARDAVARVADELGAEHPAMVSRLANLAAVLVAQGQHPAAEAELRRALEVAGRALPSEHPTLAHVHANLGAVLLYRGQLDEADAQLLRALSLWQHAHSDEHDLVADALVNLGVAARGRGRTQEAERYYQRALTRYAEVYESHHPKVAMVELNLGKALMVLERFDDAAEHLGRALAAFERYGGPRHANVGKTLEARGLLDYRRGQYPSAREQQQRALRIFEHAYPAEPPHPRVARALWALGRTELRLGETESARARLERALAMQRTAQVRPLDRARTEWTLAGLEARRPQGRARAEALAAQARDRLAGESGSAVEQLRAEIEAGFFAPDGR